MRQNTSVQWATTTAVLLASFSHPTTAQSLNPKRGLAYHDPAQRSEYNIFFTANSTITWYFNWNPWPSLTAPTAPGEIQFLPLIHGVNDIQSTVSRAKKIPTNKPVHTHLLTFNEPDGSTESGGSDISPSDAASAYIQYIVPLRQSTPSPFLISHPCTTGSGSGLDWLRAFNESCYELDPENGCPSDFVAAHFYGDFSAMAAWLGTLHALYPTLPIYLTEFALPQADVPATLQMMNQSLTYLDELDYVVGYAWFGLFQPSEANNWTGPGVSLLDDQAGLSELGSLYLGGPERGYPVGMKSKSTGGGSNGGDGGDSTSGGLPTRGLPDGALARLLLLVAIAVAVPFPMLFL